jgi:hypothetical protein
MIDPRDILQRILADPVRCRYIRWGYEENARVSEFNQTPYVKNFLHIHQMTFFERKYGVFSTGDIILTLKSKCVLIDQLAYIPASGKNVEIVSQAEGRWKTVRLRNMQAVSST